MSYDVDLHDTTHSDQGVTVYTKNWTHNFSPALNAAGLSLPDCDGMYAHQAAQPIAAALEKIRQDPEHYRSLIRGGGIDPNPGTLERMVDDLAGLLEACTTHFAARMSV